ncbi:MAG: winged helix-turn-helix domain-containing protein [Ktedonobacteraceae bacterium]|nr:winged helix-turn-helix domain-containing protein [Ktedonobacteraceae bacterium]
MHSTVEHDHLEHPVMRIITLGEFALERLVPPPSRVQDAPPRYTPVERHEWSNRGPAMALLKVLLCRANRQASRNELIEAIWPDHETINATHALDSAASILRRHILRTGTAGKLLHTLHGSGDTIFKLSGQHLLWVDADAFLALVSKAMRAEYQGQNPVPLLEEAYALARGEFLEDDLCCEWAQRRRHTITGARHRVLFKLVNLYLKDKQVGLAEELLFAWLEKDPTNEDVLCHLLILLVEQGRRQEALQLYQYSKEILQEEQGEPAIYTRELVRRIQQGHILREQGDSYTTEDTQNPVPAGRSTQPGQRPEDEDESGVKRIQHVREDLVKFREIQKRSACYASLRKAHAIAMRSHQRQREHFERRYSSMHMIMDKMYCGNYKFVVEFDSGSETGSNQLTVWAAEKTDIAAVPLKQIGTTHLLEALIEPERSRLHAQLEEERRACRQPFELEIATLQHAFKAAGEKQEQKIPGKIKRDVRKLRQQMNIALQRLEAEFARRELWSLDRQWYDRDTLLTHSHVYNTAFFLRNCYFEEANDPYIYPFCQTFAQDEAYRQQVFAGETPWARRNALFVRNLFAVAGEDALFLNKRDYDRKAHDFFRWIDTHFEEILTLPEYQYIQEIDSAFQPCWNELDPLIRPAVEALNRLPGVTTQFSCQGVSGKVHFQGRDLLVVSPHEEYAYVSFSKLEQPAHDAIIRLLPTFPGITNASIPYPFALSSVLRATGDNLRFREELVELAERALASVGTWSTQQGESGLTSGTRETQNATNETKARESEEGPVPGGISLSRLAWLCQPERIERTLHLLFYINHWAKAREQLLYADRQGLYRVKAALIQQAFTAGLLSPVAYIDGSADFARDYAFDFTTDMAAEVFLSRLAMLFEDNTYRPADGDELDATALSLFARIVGREATTRVDIETLDEERVKRFLHEQLATLVEQARSTRQPIPGSELAALCIEPIDLINIYWSRSHPAPRWNELDEGEAVQIDPEGLSLISFEYASATAHYIFHLPFRVAERFLPEQHMHTLKNLPENSRECGVFFGRTITEEESQQHPIEDILRELGVDVAAVCAYKLTDKKAYVPQLASRYPYWDNDEEEEDEEEEDWVIPSQPESHKHKGVRTPGACPLCGSTVEPDATQRSEHWRQSHHDQDLTVSQGAWLLGKSKADFTFSASAIQPDYRGPASELHGNGTRFWRLATLETTLKQSQECPREGMALASRESSKQEC